MFYLYVLSLCFIFFYFFVLSLCFILFYFFANHTVLAGGVFVQPQCCLPGLEKRIALTFDDGPNAEWTARILDVLKAHGVPGTFFLLGKHAEQYPHLVNRLRAEGHELASHGYSHRKMSVLGRAEIVWELTRTEALIGWQGSGPRPLFRPPHGRKSPLLEWLLRRSGIRLVHWSLSPKDWKEIPSTAVLERMLRFVEAGSIILLHDSPKALAVLPEFIGAMKARDYTFVTVSSVS